MVSLAFVFQQTGRGEGSVALFEDALDLARRAGDLSLLLRAQLHICGALEEVRGDYARGETLVREGLQLAHRTGNVANIAWMRQMLSDLMVDTGRLEEAHAEVRHALDESRKVGDALVIAYALERIAYLHALRGEPDEAERALEEARPTIRENPEPWLRGWAPLIEGHIAQARNRHDDAARILSEGAHALADKILVWGGQNLLLECVRTLVRVGRPAEARPFKDSLAKMAPSSVPARAFLAWAEALLAEDARGARDRLADAAGQFERLGRRIELGRCLVDLGLAQRRVGEDPAPAFARGREILESCGAALFLREAQAASAER
jgi:ATP/maltotriose-dependent transcriptional regulator MalT